MLENPPPKLKVVASYAKRAAQLDRHKPIIAYWIRFYMTQKIISAELHLADQACTTYTTSLMEKLEQTKAENPTEDALVDETAAYAYCEQFALQVFSKGDKDMTENKVNKNTTDTLLAASTFFDILSIWKKDPDPEIKSKQTYAKYHAVRITKALQAGEDPNLTNPTQETQQPDSAPTLDPSDPDVQSINQAPLQPPPTQNPYQQPYVESAPNTSAQPSPNFAPRVSPPPPSGPSAPAAYSQNSHRDVSPISQPSRHGSVASAGGGYFPKVDVPTFTAGTTTPGLATAPSADDDENMTSLFETSSLPTGPQMPQAPKVPDPADFYQNPPSPPSVPPVPQQPPQQPPFANDMVQAPQTYATPPPAQPPLPSQQPSHFQPNPGSQQHYQYSPQPSQPQMAAQQFSQPIPPVPLAQSQGPFNSDEDSLTEAQKHAKWAISAMNFEDANTAVKELRIALKALGAN